MASSAVGEHGAFRQAADFHLVGFRAVGVDKSGGDRRDLNRGVFQTVVVDVAGVIAFAIHNVAVAQDHACGFQRGRTGVGLQATVAQGHRRTVVDRHIDVVVARAVLVVVVDVEGVVTRLGRRVGRPVDTAALAPGFGSDQLAAHGDSQTVVGRAGEGVALASFQVNQTGHFGRGAFGHIAVAYIAGHARGGGAVSGLGVDHFDQGAGLGDALAVSAQLARQVAAGPGLNGQTGWHLADGQHRHIRHRVNIHSDGFGIAVGVAVGGLELQLGVITLLVAHAGVAEAVVARLVVCRGVTHVVGIEVSLSEGLARRGVGFQIGRGELDPLTVDFVFDGAGRQAGEHHCRARGIFVLHTESRPSELDRGVFVALDAAVDGGWGVIDQRDSRLASVVGIKAFRVGDGQVDFWQLITGIDEIGAFLGQHDIVAGEAVVAVSVGAGGEADGQAFTRRFFVTRVERTGDGANFGGVFDDGSRRDVDQRYIVDQGYGRLASAGGIQAFNIGNGQVDFRQLVTSVNEVSTFFGQDHVVAGDGVVAVSVGASGEADVQVFARGFFIFRDESTGDGACFGGVLDDGSRRDSNYWDVVNQSHGRLAGAGGVQAFNVSNGQVDLRQLVASVNEVSAFFGQDYVVAGDGVVAICVGASGEADVQVFAWGFFVFSDEGTGDSACFSGVLDDGGRRDSNHRNIVNQRYGRLTGTGGIQTFNVGNGQVDLRQLVAGINEVSTFFGQDYVVAGDGVVAVSVGASGKADGQTIARGFFVFRDEGTGDGACFSSVFNDGGRRDSNYWYVVDQGHGRLTGASGVQAFNVGDGEVDLRQLVASVNEVSAFFSQYNVVAGDGVVTVSVGASGEADVQVFARGFFVFGNEGTGDGACFGSVFNDGGRRDSNYRYVVNQRYGRLTGASGVQAFNVSNGQVDLRQLVAGINEVSTFFGQDHVVAGDGVVAVSVGASSEADGQTIAWCFFVFRDEGTGDGACFSGVLDDGGRRDSNYWDVVNQGHGRLTGAGGVQAFNVGDGQVDLRQLVTSVNEVRAFFGQHDVVTGDGVVAVSVGACGEADGQTIAWCFFVFSDEGTGDSACFSSVLNDGGRRDSNHRNIVNQRYGRLTGASGIQAFNVSNGQVDLRQLVASVNEVSTFFSQHDVVAGDGVVTVSVGACGEADVQVLAWGFFVFRDESTGDGACFSSVLDDGSRRDSNYRNIVNQGHGRLTGAGGIQAFNVSNGQVDLR
ncbi:Allene oxide cyclase [Pseudomonas sp. RIT357]|nr:Allene oxide cyclase [Pseudomonas sp. RIT357]